MQLLNTVPVTVMTPLEHLQQGGLWDLFWQLDKRYNKIAWSILISRQAYRVIPYLYGRQSISKPYAAKLAKLVHGQKSNRPFYLAELSSNCLWKTRGRIAWAVDRWLVSIFCPAHATMRLIIIEHFHVTLFTKARSQIHCVKPKGSLGCLLFSFWSHF